MVCSIMYELWLSSYTSTFTMAFFYDSHRSVRQPFRIFVTQMQIILNFLTMIIVGSIECPFCCLQYQYQLLLRWLLFLFLLMLAGLGTTKPLYQFQRNLDYKKHKLKLRQIRNKSFSLHSGSVEIRPWVRQNIKSQMQRQNKQIESQNQKLLTKLMKISTRNSFQTSQVFKQRDNPHRKNWLKNIKKQNEELGEKLTHLRSSLEYSRFSKSIDSYEKIKKSMMINRKAKLPQLNIKLAGLDQSRKIMKTQPITLNTQQGEQDRERVQKLFGSPENNIINTVKSMQKIDSH